MNTPYSILIVEDDEGLSRQIQKRLEKAGYRTHQVYNGDEAITYVVENPDTLMLLDYYLPDMTGKKVLDELNNRQCMVNFVVITASGDEKLAVDMMKRGAIDYIAKELNFTDLIPTVVERAINRIDSERKLAEALEKQKKLVCELQDALANIKTLSGLLPICASCKKIRDDKGYWNQIEIYIKKHSNADFTHGICPECQKKLYPDLFPSHEQ